MITHDSHLSLLYSWHCCKWKQSTKPLPGLKILSLWLAAQKSVLLLSCKIWPWCLYTPRGTNTMFSLPLTTKMVSVHLYLYSVATAKHTTCARGLIFEDFEVSKSSEVTSPRCTVRRSKACCHLQRVPEGMCDTKGSPSVQAVLTFLEVQCRNPLWALMYLSSNRSSLDFHP